MAKSSRTLGLAAATLVLASLAAQEPQQQQQPPQSQPPVFRTGINYVRVDVIVNDNKTGQPISDLKETDFEVLEDGKPQKIEALKLIKLDGGTADAVKEPVKQIKTDYDEESEAARDDVRLFGIFLDDYHVRKGTSLSVRNPLTRFIDTQIGPSDMVGVMYPLESINNVRFTRNHDAVMRGLQQFVGRKYDYTPKNEMEEQYAHYPTETVEQIRNQVSLSAIKGLIIHMGSLKEGRKALIVVSEGWTNALPPQMRNADATMPGLGNPNAFNPLAGDGDVNEQRYQTFAGFDMISDLRNVFDEANRQNVAIYTVDPRGLPGFEFDINENVGIRMDSTYLQSTQDTLRNLAENTDGRAIVNRNDLDVGMKQIMRDSSAYYLLGYNSSQAPTDGKFHEIKVRVKRPNVQVRARKGYWALNKDETARAIAGPKNLAPKPVENAIAEATARPSKASVIRSWIGTSRGENGKTRVTFVWEPLPKSPGDRTIAGEEPSRVSLMALTGDGAPSFRGKVPEAPVSPIRSPQRVEFEVPPGKLQLRIAVEGNAAQTLDTETREITIPDLTAAATALGTPEVFRARTVPELNKMKADPQAIPTAIREFYRSDRIILRVPTYGPGDTTPKLSVHLLNRAGQSMNELAVTTAPKAGEQQIDLPVAALPNGEYVVEIKAAGDGGEATSLVGFRIMG